jgi:hypothetical protein
MIPSIVVVTVLSFLLNLGLNLSLTTNYGAQGAALALPWRRGAAPVRNNTAFVG